LRRVLDKSSRAGETDNEIPRSTVALPSERRRAARLREVP
jgi:hypothetical protein